MKKNNRKQEKPEKAQTKKQEKPEKAQTKKQEKLEKAQTKKQEKPEKAQVKPAPAPAPVPVAEPVKPAKPTDAERQAAAEKLRKTAVYHRCQAVPFNGVEWLDGTVVGVIEEKRTNKVLLAIRLDNGSRIVKVYGSAQLRILDETAEAPHRGRAKKEFEPWTQEALADEVAKYIDNVGRMVKFAKYGSGEEKEGRIVAIVPDKRVNMLLYRIDCGGSYLNKNVTCPRLEIAGEFDEVGAAVNAKYRQRREALAQRVPATPQDRVVACEESLKKAEDMLKAAQERVELRKKQLEDAKAELAAFLDRETEE